MSIPFEEWEYVEKDENEVFPKIVKEQIYNNPRKYGIDIDSACNGVLLPGGSKTNDYSWVINEANHFGGHSDNYYETVNNELRACKQTIEDNNLNLEEAQNEICKTLHKIRIKLLNGELKIQNKETLIIEGK